MRRRIYSLFLAILLFISSCPVTVQAEGELPKSATGIQEEMETAEAGPSIENQVSDGASEKASEEDSVSEMTSREEGTENASGGSAGSGEGSEDASGTEPDGNHASEETPTETASGKDPDGSGVSDSVPEQTGSEGIGTLDVSPGQAGQDGNDVSGTSPEQTGSEGNSTSDGAPEQTGSEEMPDENQTQGANAASDGVPGNASDADAVPEGDPEAPVSEAPVSEGAVTEGAVAEEALQIWDESQEIMLYGLSDMGRAGNREYTLDEVMAQSVNWMLNQGVMSDSFLNGVSSTATDWSVFDLGRLGVEGQPYDKFAERAAAYVAERYGDPENYPYKLSNDRLTATEWHRLTVALQAAGRDPANISGQNLIKDGVYDCVLGDPWNQGTNGAIWALIALDTKGYDVPEDAKYDREALIGYLLKVQLKDGAWPLSPDSEGSTDITGMALQALAPYYAGNTEVRTAVDNGIEYLKRELTLSEDGSLGDCETTAQAIVAFTALGIDPAEIKSVRSDSLIDGLMAYFNADKGAFVHESIGEGANGMATDQALYALIAYRRFLAGDTSLYDFREHADRYASGYEIRNARTDGMVYSMPAGTDVSLAVAPGVETVVLEHLPLGDYDAAVVTTDADGSSYRTSYRRADGRIPVDGEIPVRDGAVLKIAVTRQNKETETWTITISEDEDANVKAVRDQIQNLPEEGKLTLADKSRVEAARSACGSLTEEQKQQISRELEKLTALEKRLAQLEQAAAAEAAAEAKKQQDEITKKINSLPVVTGISDKDAVNIYLAQLSDMDDWSGKAALMNRLNACLTEIAGRQALVTQLDNGIWEKIDPLDISQNDAKTVKSLMTSYSVLRQEEQAALQHADNLLEAAEVIQSLEEGVIPARVFQNLKAAAARRSASGKKTFTYQGTLKDGSAYTLSWQAEDVTSTGDVDAGVTLSGGSGILKGTKAQVELAQEGSMNGKAELTVKSSVASGTYDLYWFNPDKLAIQSAKTADVSDGTVTMNVSMGGRYWLSDKTVRLDGNQADGSVSGAASSTVKSLTKTSLNSSTIQNAARSLVRNTSGSSSTSGSTKTSAAGKARTAVRSAAGSAGKVLEIAKDGLFSEKELKLIKDKDQNLQGRGKLADGTEYTITINGKDVKKTEDFRYGIRSDCDHEKGILALSEEPLVLCMEELETFPGKMLFSVQKDAEEGTPLLFRYDPQKEAAEYVKKVTAEDGMMEFILSEGGVYFIAERALASPVEQTRRSGIQTSGRAAENRTEQESPAVWDEASELMVTGTKEVTGPGSEVWLMVIAISSCIIALAALGGSMFLFVKLGGPERFFKKKEEDGRGGWD